MVDFKLALNNLNKRNVLSNALKSNIQPEEQMKQSLAPKSTSASDLAAALSGKGNRNIADENTIGVQNTIKQAMSMTFDNVTLAGKAQINIEDLIANFNNLIEQLEQNLQNLSVDPNTLGDIIRSILQQIRSTPALRGHINHNALRTIVRGARASYAQARNEKKKTSDKRAKTDEMADALTAAFRSSEGFM